MKLTISLEQRYQRTPDGHVWTPSVGGYQFWSRYLKVFDKVDVVARVQNVTIVPNDFIRADGERVKFVDLPYYVGPWQYLVNAYKIEKILKFTAKESDAVLLRIPGQISNVFSRHLNKLNHPYGVEVVGDPYDVFAPGAVGHPLRVFFRQWGQLQMESQCSKAIAAAYVTEHTLQKRYPCNSPSFGVSDVELRGSKTVTARESFGVCGTFTLTLVGSLAQLYKAPDIFIKAVAICVGKGYKIKANIIGDGKYRQQLEVQVDQMGLRGNIAFLGNLPAGEAVQNELLKADIFVLPSRTEGLPRAMIEAMACALPCIGSNVGGIPELLSASDLVPPGNAQVLADKIEEVITSPARMRSMSARNLIKSMDFRNDILDLRRNQFYTYVQQKTEGYLLYRRQVN